MAPERVGDQHVAVEEIGLALLVGVEARRAPAGVDADLADRQVPTLADPAVSATGVVLQREVGRDAAALGDLQRIRQVRPAVVARCGRFDQRQAFGGIGELQPVDRAVADLPQVSAVVRGRASRRWRHPAGRRPQPWSAGSSTMPAHCKRPGRASTENESSSSPPILPSLRPGPVTLTHPWGRRAT